MKTCNQCKAQNDDAAKFCTYCGSSDLSESQTGQTQVYSPMNEAVQPNPAYPAQPVPPAEPSLGNGNVIAGIVGAFLLALVGGLLYFVIYQLGVIAGICGLVIFVLANFGYSLFAKSDKNSIVGLVVSILMTIAMIYLAEFLCISYEIFQVYKDGGITIFDAIRATPEFLEEPELVKAVAHDLVFAYIFGFIATISNIVNIVKSRKKK